MKYLEATFAEAARNLACDEALIECCEDGQADGVLRIWEPTDYFVVLGYSNRLATEVDVAACERIALPILRRFSGGGTVLQGPGCVNYAVVLSNDRAGNIPATYEFVLKRHQGCIAELLQFDVHISGGSDLTVSGRKFSGNAQHRKRHFTVVHGTFLLNFDFSLIQQILPHPSREPAYRQRRSHNDFLMNLPIEAELLKRALRAAWKVNEKLDCVPDERIDRLVGERYSRREWNLKF
jgi:lipoate-protein ligase A